MQTSICRVRLNLLIETALLANDETCTAMFVSEMPECLKVKESIQTHDGIKSKILGEQMDYRINIKRWEITGRAFESENANFVIFTRQDVDVCYLHTVVLKQLVLWTK